MRNHSLLVVMAVTSAICRLCTAQQVAISWSTVDAGGGRVVAGSGLALEGTIGQADVGVSAAGSLQGQWGFWPGIAGTPCRSDFDGNGTVNSTDVSEFINAWFSDLASGTLLTDWDGNGVVNSTDVSEFINTWFADVAGGCAQ